MVFLLARTHMTELGRTTLRSHQRHDSQPQRTKNKTLKHPLLPLLGLHRLVLDGMHALWPLVLRVFHLGRRERPDGEDDDRGALRDDARPHHLLRQRRLRRRA